MQRSTWVRSTTAGRSRSVLASTWLKGTSTAPTGPAHPGAAHLFHAGERIAHDQDRAVAEVESRQERGDAGGG